MNAYATTALGLAETFAAISKQLPNGVFLVRSTFGERSPFSGQKMTVHRVLWQREYWDCTDRELALIRAGMTPDDLGLEPVEDDDA